MNEPTTYDLTRPRTLSEEYLLRIATALEGIEKASWANVNKGKARRELHPRLKSGQTKLNL
jgi:hypothetical protein